MQACPLGALYLSIVYSYALLVKHADSEVQTRHSETVSSMLRAFPILVIAGSRWPVYEALHHFSGFHEPISQRSSAVVVCQGAKSASGIDWGQLLKHANLFCNQGMLGLEPGQGSLEHTLSLKTVMDAFGAEPQRVADAAQNECPLGLLFLCVVQMAAAAMRLTGRVQSWAESVEKLMKDLPFYLVSASQWPIYPVLGMLSAMFQRPEYSRALGRQFHGEVHRWGGTHPVAKRFRAFGDLRLLPEELMPFGFDETAETQVEILAAASPYEWLIGMADASQVLKMRPIFRTVLDIIMQLVRASQRHQLRECGYSGISHDRCRVRGCSWNADALPACQLPQPKRKVVLTTFMWGQRWSRLIPAFVAWMHKLHIPTLVVAMGQACREACEVAVEANGGWANSLVGCWDPFAQLAKKTWGPRLAVVVW